ASSKKTSRRRRSPNLPVFASVAALVATKSFFQSVYLGDAAANGFDRGLGAGSRADTCQLDRPGDLTRLDDLDHLGDLANQSGLLERQHVDFGQAEFFERGQRHFGVVLQ